MISLKLNSGKNIDDMYHFTRTAGNFCPDKTKGNFIIERVNTPW